MSVARAFCTDTLCNSCKASLGLKPESFERRYRGGPLGGDMYKGYKIIDMDTHVGPATEVLEKYIEPGFRQRLPELDRYKRVRIQEIDGVKTKRGTVLTVAPITYDRYPGTPPKADDLKSEA